ncbi:MAG: hypothetical protein HYY18_08755, partial [Planctomycetes bacterium]|nr:hypothetical protein [Planctomycetota bacterium]
PAAPEARLETLAAPGTEKMVMHTSLLRTDSGHRLYLVDPWLQCSAADIADLRWPVCLIAADHPVDAGVVRPALYELIREGATYMCFFAPNALRLHDLADELDIHLTESKQIPSDRGEVLMTVGEDGELLDKALSFFSLCAWPPNHDSFDRLVLPLGLPHFKQDLVARLQTSEDF